MGPRWLGGLPNNLTREIRPAGVVAFDQPHLLVTRPTLDLLLAGYGHENVSRHFEMQQVEHFVT